MQYQTEQKRILLDFLNAHANQSFSIEDLIAQMAADPSIPLVPGKSTVYRLIQKLVSDGTVRRFVRENGRQFVYQAAGGAHCATHLHMKCTVCGRLYHMDNRVTRRILREMESDEQFAVNVEQTVFFGICAQCGTGKGNPRKT